VHSKSELLRPGESLAHHIYHIDKLRVQITIKMVLPRWVDAAEGANASDSSSDEEDDQIEIQREVLNSLQGDVIEPDQPSEEPSEPDAARINPKPGKISIKIGGSGGGGAVCHVCGKSGHSSGFLPGTGTYVDCINKPCYLCGGSGHRTSSCPHRLAPELHCKAAADVSTCSIVQHLIERERQGRINYSLAPNPGRWNVDAAVLKLHARRTTCLEFHPTKDNIVLSGDKHGQIAVWDVDKVFERTVYTNMNRWLTNALKFMPSTAGGGGNTDAHVATASYDGTVKVVDIEVGTQVRTLVDANPRGWEYVVEEDKAGNWVTFIGMDVMPTTGAVVAGDNKGKVYFLDPRMEEPAAVVQVHKKNTKVQSVSVNPISDCLVLTAGNDYQARLVDARCLGSSGGILHGGGEGIMNNLSNSSNSNSAEVSSFAHSRVINAAYFSPITGRKILTTAQDNRLRVWDDFSSSLGCPPNREIVHSHTFNRHLTAFKAEWDPKDPHERLAIIGRYISESYDGTALHPIDLIDVATGANVGELVDPNLTTICPVNKAHPRKDVIITGSSRSLYAWKPEAEEEEEASALAVSARMAANAAEWAAASSDGIRDGAGGSKGPRTPFLLRGSANYMFFDADEGAAGKKKRAATKTPAATGEGSSKATTKTTPKSKRTKTEKKPGKTGDKDDEDKNGSDSE